MKNAAFQRVLFALHWIWGGLTYTHGIMTQQTLYCHPSGFPGLGPTIEPQPEPARGHRCIMASLGQMIKAHLKCAKCLCH